MSYAESNISNEQYITAKNELEAQMDEKMEGQILRSKCQWFKYAEKSSKLFLKVNKEPLNV